MATVVIDEEETRNRSSSNSTNASAGLKFANEAAGNDASLNSPPDVPSPAVISPSIPTNVASLSDYSAAGLVSTDANAKVTPAVQPAPSASKPVPAPKARLPHDTIGIYEDRIKEDPRGDTEAWLSLIAEHRKRDKTEEARNVYNRFFTIFPMAAEQLVAYAEMELEYEHFYEAEQIFSKYLQNVPSVQLWKVYLDYVRRRNNLTTDTTGQARTVVSQSYDFVLDNVGNDPESGQLWQEYIHFVRSGPGTPGGAAWQDQQKMDQLRKAYQRAICVPNQYTTTFWKEYNSFETSLNKQTGRKFLQDKSPSYVSAQTAYKAWQAKCRGLQRTTLAKLPPADGFDGSLEYTAQVALWKTWISWEKEDQLALKDEDLKAFNNRILYVYKQALMALRFWPQMWYDAAEYCFQSGLDTEGDEFLVQGIIANPESLLLAFRRADRLEATLPVEEGDEGTQRRGASVREPFDKLLNSLYELLAKTKAKEAQELDLIEQMYSGLPPLPVGDDEDISDEDKERHRQKAQQIEGTKLFSGTREKSISLCISNSWIALMRSMRRVQGRGSPNGPVGGSRRVFADARKKGKILPDVYAAAATMEHYCYRDPVAKGIFERGAKLFPEDAEFALKYLKHLITTNDPTNARAFFELAVGRLISKPENVLKAKPLFDFFHEYESNYGELSQLRNLEKRMKEIFPAESQLERFSHRFRNAEVDPTSIRLVISPAVQLKPRMMMKMPEPAKVDSPPYRSPKRALEESEYDNRPAKIMRSDSPIIKGAAGRKLHQQKQNASQDLRSGWTAPVSQPPEQLPSALWFVLSMIPRASQYQSTRFTPEKVIGLLRRTVIPQNDGRPPPRPYSAANGPPPPPPSMGQMRGMPAGMPYMPPGMPQPNARYY
ncbi:MAG: mRNA 3'-end-processing protein rna14 [Vezdaea aestivalis]|nr:MAG: mRNA 3'-end-processing protein rna14 [Vezdaea aestivalis]